MLNNEDFCLSWVREFLPDSEILGSYCLYKAGIINEYNDMDVYTKVTDEMLDTLTFPHRLDIGDLVFYQDISSYDFCENNLVFYSYKNIEHKLNLIFVPPRDWNSRDSKPLWQNFDFSILHLKLINPYTNLIKGSEHQFSVDNKLINVKDDYYASDHIKSCRLEKYKTRLPDYKFMKTY